MGACETCCKVVLVIVNLLFGLVGLALLAAGVLVKVGQAYIQPLLDSVLGSLPNLQGAVNLADGATSSPSDGNPSSMLNIGEILNGLSVGLICIGVFLFIISCLGCCGACCTVKVMLIIYVIIIGVIFLAEFIIVIVFFTGSFDASMRSQVNSTLTQNYGGIDSFDPWSLLFNFLMVQYKCCGIDNYMDFYYCDQWKRNRTFTMEGQEVTLQMVTPIACCKTTGDFPSVTPIDTNCTFTPTDVNSNFNTGCWTEVRKQTKAFEGPLVGVCAGTLVFEALVIAMAILVLILSSREKVGVV